MFKNNDLTENEQIVLQEFFPYRIRRFYTKVSGAVARIYQDRYDMKPDDWRVMVILGFDSQFTAAQIVEKSSIDKVAVSRAVARMRKRGWLIETANKDDGRSRILGLSKNGLAVYADLVPRMQKLEQDLLSPLSSDELNCLLECFEKVSAQADRAHDNAS